MEPLMDTNEREWVQRLEEERRSAYWPPLGLAPTLHETAWKSLRFAFIRVHSRFVIEGIQSTSVLEDILMTNDPSTFAAPIMAAFGVSAPPRGGGHFGSCRSEPQTDQAPTTSSEQSREPNRITSARRRADPTGLRPGHGSPGCCWV